MIEKILLDYLAAALNVPVMMERPPDAPDTFVLLEKTGSGRENHLCTAILAVQAYAPSLLEAARLNERAKAAMLAAVRLPAVAAVRLNGDYNFTDTAMKGYRYQAVFDVTHYE